MEKSCGGWRRKNLWKNEINLCSETFPEHFLRLWLFLPQLVHIEILFLLLFFSSSLLFEHHCKVRNVEEFAQSAWDRGLISKFNATPLLVKPQHEFLLGALDVQKHGVKGGVTYCDYVMDVRFFWRTQSIEHNHSHLFVFFFLTFDHPRQNLS